MRVELLVVPDCPHAESAEVLLRDALSRMELTAEPDVVLIQDEDAALAHGFVGSPSFFLDGLDLIPEPAAPPAMACRVYSDGHQRLSGVPSLETLTRAIETRTAGG